MHQLLVLQGTPFILFAWCRHPYLLTVHALLSSSPYATSSQACQVGSTSCSHYMHNPSPLYANIPQISNLCIKAGKGLLSRLSLLFQPSRKVSQKQHRGSLGLLLRVPWLMQESKRKRKSKCCGWCRLNGAAWCQRTASRWNCHRALTAHRRYIPQQIVTNLTPCWHHGVIAMLVCAKHQAATSFTAC